MAFAALRGVCHPALRIRLIAGDIFAIRRGERNRVRGRLDVARVDRGQRLEVREDVSELLGKLRLLLFTEAQASQERDVMYILASERHPRLLTQGVGWFNAAPPGAACGRHGIERVASMLGMTDPRSDLGRAGERAAEEFLRRRRYTILARNFRCRAGEVDLIALHGGVLVFVEVKARQRGAAVGPFEALSARQQQRIARAARYYIERQRLHGRLARFDVVGVWQGEEGFVCEVVENAFEVRV